CGGLPGIRRTHGSGRAGTPRILWRALPRRVADARERSASRRRQLLSRGRLGAQGGGGHRRLGASQGAAHVRERPLDPKELQVRERTAGSVQLTDVVVDFTRYAVSCLLSACKPG